MESLSPQLSLLGRLISATEMRQRAISHNIANVNTPNYQRIDVEFESQLALELKGTASGEATPSITVTKGLTARADGNMDENEPRGVGFRAASAHSKLGRHGVYPRSKNAL